MANGSHKRKLVIYRWTDSNGSIQYSSKQPSSAPAGGVAYNATGKVVAGAHWTQLDAENQAKSEYKREDAEAEEAYQQRVKDAQTSCTEELAAEHRDILARAASERRDFSAIAANSQNASVQAGHALNATFAANNTARYWQNFASEALGLAGGRVAAPGAGFLTTLASIATSVPALPGAAPPDVPVGVDTGFAVQGAATDYLINNAAGRGLAHAPSIIYVEGQRLRGAVGVIGDVKAVGSLLSGPDLHRLLGFASESQLLELRASLENADLAFLEEWFGADAEELQKAIDERLASMRSAATDTEFAERAEDNEEYAKKLVVALYGTCVLKRSDVNLRNSQVHEAAQKRDRKLAKARGEG